MITAYSDAAFSNNAELSSQLGCIVLLTDDCHNAIPVSYKSYKSRRVIRSVLYAEVNAFADLFHDTLAVCRHLDFITRQSMLLQIRKDYKRMLDIISKASLTSKKRIMVDMYIYIYIYV